MAHLGMRGYDIHHTENITTVSEVLASSSFEVIFFVDKKDDFGGPDFLKSLEQVLPGKYIFVLLDNESLAKYQHYEGKNILGYFSNQTNLAILEHLCNLFMANNLINSPNYG